MSKRNLHEEFQESFEMELHGTPECDTILLMNDTQTLRIHNINSLPLIKTGLRGDSTEHDLRLINRTGDNGTIQQADLEAGFQLAEFGTTGFMVFVRVTDRVRYNRNWRTSVNEVEIFDVDTVVVDGVIWAGVGAQRPTGMTGSFNVERVSPSVSVNENGGW